MNRYLRDRGAPDSSVKELQPRMVAYLTMLLRGKNLTHMSAEQSRELRTLAEALDALGHGNLSEVADLLMQRFKSREHAALTGQEDLAKHLELIPAAEGGLISAGERSMAAAAQLQEAKIIEASRKAHSLSEE